MLLWYASRVDKKFINIGLEVALVDAIEEFRFKQKFGTRADAIRWLLAYALKAKPKRD